MNRDDMTCDNSINAAHAALLRRDFQYAEQLYREVLEKEPENIRALDGLGVLLCQIGDTEAGIALFTQALDLLRQASQPNPHWSASLLFHLGLSFRTLGLHPEALQAFTEAVTLTPHNPDLTLNLGQVYFELEHYPEAAEQFRALTVMQPENASAWLTLGFVLSNLDRHDEAAEVLRTAESLDPTSPDICLYLAEALRKAERYGESLPPYQRLLQVGAEYPQALCGYGKSLLALGNLEQGWDAMEFRFVSSIGSWERHDLPNWSPDANPEGSRVLAYSEEGIGAELMFASCLPDLINSVDHCVVECESSLHTLFRRSFPRAEFVPLADDNVRPEDNPWDIPLDAQIAFGSLPRYFRRHIDDFPLRKAYLVPDKEQVVEWSTRLAGLGDAKKIGFLWQGTWTAETPKQTLLPLYELRSLMTRYQGASWICLQHGSYQNELNQQRGTSVTHRIFPEAFQYDLDSMAALLTALDLVITPPGYVAHLAGALGVRTWLLVPEGADWRHSIDTISQPRSIWHPTVKMYRQAKGQTWQHFFETLESDLTKFLTTYRPPEEIPATLAFPQRRSIVAPKSA
jgi:tetratricopeptide (TPR) repeat protein